jgi:hypothetical protein
MKINVTDGVLGTVRLGSDFPKARSQRGGGPSRAGGTGRMGGVGWNHGFSRPPYILRSLQYVVYLVLPILTSYLRIPCTSTISVLSNGRL